MEKSHFQRLICVWEVGCQLSAQLNKQQQRIQIWCSNIDHAKKVLGTRYKIYLYSVFKDTKDPNMF